MKKLMIAAAIVCAAVVSQAAVANWNTSANGIYDGTDNDGDAALYTGVAYLMNGTTLTQSQAFDLLTSGSDLTKQAAYIKSFDIDAGSISKTSFTYGNQGDAARDFYFVVVEEDKAYFSNVKNLAAATTDTAKAIGFGDQDNYSKTFSDVKPGESVSFEGAGYWSTTQAVPEPFSGALALLGMGAIALRRKMKKAKKA